MYHLRLSLCAMLGFAFLSGCSSSSTSGSNSTGTSSKAQTQKSPDDEVNELIVTAMTMSQEEKRAKGEAMGKRVMELRSQVSEDTRKRIDELMLTGVRSVSSGGSQGESRSSPEPSAAEGSPPRVQTVDPPIATVKPKSAVNENLPLPREVKN